MPLTEEERQGLNVALNEATLLGVAANESRREVAVGLSVLALPEAGAETDPVITLVLRSVGRIVASLRNGRWDDADATVEPVSLEELPSVLDSFGHLPIYGWEFFDPPESSWEHWRERLSLDEQWGSGRSAHVIELFQGDGPGPPRHLDLRIWFDDLAVIDRDGNEISVQEFIARGVRWSDALYAGDLRTEGHGIFPLGAPAPDRKKGLRALLARRPKRGRRE